jgi:tetratricopeptide (TPR) repeat protein
MDIALDNYLDVAQATRDPAVAERAVRIAVFARDQERGLEAAELWTALAPDDIDARRIYGALLLRAGRIDQTVEQLHAIVEPPNDDETRFSLIGDMLAREKDKATAVQVMERIVATHQDNPHAIFAFARLLGRTGDFERSLDVLGQLLEKDPSYQRAVVYQARILQREGRTSEALAVLTGYLERAPDTPDVRMTYARLLVDAKRYEEARTQFELLSEQSPEDADVLYALGLLLLQTNRNEEAREQFRKLVDLGKRVDAAYYYLGQIAESGEELDAALDAYRHVDRGDHRLNAQIRVAMILAEQGDVSKARAHLQGIRVRNQQEAVRVYRSEAEILVRKDRLMDAMSVYDVALEEFPENNNLLYARAMLAEKLNMLDVLERDLRDVLSREPNNADALNALGYTLADRTDRYEEALEFIKRAYELKPDDHYIVDSMGWIMYRLGRHDEAVKYLRRAMELNGDSEIAAHLGEVLWVLGDKKAAREIWDTALETTPEDKRLLDVIKRFGR